MNRPAPPLFHEAQRFRQWRLRILLALPPAFFWFLLIWQVWLGHAWGKHPMSNAGVIFLLVVLSLLYLRLVTVRLDIAVFDEKVRVALRGAFWRRWISGNTIQAAKAVSYNAVRDYGGYGIRSGRLGRAYIAGGSRGVLLKLAGGEQVLLGSNRPDELAAVILRIRKPA